MGADSLETEARQRPYEPVDPFSPLNLPAVQEPGCGVKGLRVRARHAMILANARKLLACQDFHGFSIKELSSICGVSPQCIHLKIGDKITIISSATNDFSNALIVRASQNADPIHRVLHYTDLLYASCRARPEFQAGWSNSAFRDELGEIIYRNARKPVTEFLRVALDKLARKSLLDRDIDTQIAAHSIAILLSNAVHDWACKAVSIDDLRKQLVEQVTTILKGLSAHSSSEEVRRSIASYVRISGTTHMTATPACG